MNEEEKVLLVAPSTLKKSIFKTETWTVIVTNKRLLFAKYSQEVFNKEVKERREEAKAEGRNKLGQFFAQASASFTWYTRYNNLPPDEVLKENPENYYLSPQDVINYQLLKGKVYRDSDDITKQDPHQLVINSNRGKFVFTTTSDYGKLQDALNTLFHS